ncbi:MAG: hypothetical protein Fues2KO_32570 [Fuerstiella sp.]
MKCRSSVDHHVDLCGVVEAFEVGDSPVGIIVVMPRRLPELLPFFFGRNHAAASLLCPTDRLSAPENTSAACAVPRIPALRINGAVRKIGQGIATRL